MCPYSRKKKTGWGGGVVQKSFTPEHFFCLIIPRNVFQFGLQDLFLCFFFFWGLTKMIKHYYWNDYKLNFSIAAVWKRLQQHLHHLQLSNMTSCSSKDISEHILDIFDSNQPFRILKVNHTTISYCSVLFSASGYLCCDLRWCCLKMSINAMLLSQT